MPGCSAMARLIICSRVRDIPDGFPPPERLAKPVVRGWWHALAMLACLWMTLACGVNADDRMVRRYAQCMADPNTALHRLTVSGSAGTVALSAEAVEERLRAQLSRGELTMAEIRAGHARYCK